MPAARTIPLYGKVCRAGRGRGSPRSRRRIRASVFVADAFEQVDESWWFIGDELRNPEKREMIAQYFGLARVFLRGFDEQAPLGLLGARFVPRYWTAGSTTPELDPSFGVGDTKGFDLAGLQRTARASVEILRRQLAPAELARFELGVTFMGAAPPLPRPQLVVARWHDGVLEGYAAQIVRKGRSTAREVVLPKTLAGRPFDIYIARIGDPVRKLGTTDGQPLVYAPWRGGVYWALACDAADCWVIAGARQGGG